MSPTLDIIKDVARAILNGDLPTISFKLRQLPLALVGNSSCEELISTLLSFCKKVDNKDAACLIINIFDELRLGVDPLPALTNLFANSIINEDTLRYAISCFPDRQPVDYYVDLINGGDDMLAIKAAGRICDLVPGMTYDHWKSLLELTKIDADTEEDELLVPPMMLLTSFFETNATKNARPISKPDWVRSYPKVELEDVPNWIPTVYDAVNLILIDMDKKIKLVSKETNKDADIKPALISQYAISTIPEKLAMIEHLKKLPDFDDTNIFREYGPVNTLYTLTDEIRDKEHPCVRYGGCRMLTCTEFEFNDEEMRHEDDLDESDEYMTYEYKLPDTGEIITDTVRVSRLSMKNNTEVEWFDGRCEKCLIPITNREEALRIPLLNGGWIGCFCLKCLKERVSDPITGLMVGRMIDQLTHIGIRSRED